MRVLLYIYIYIFVYIGQLSVTELLEPMLQVASQGNKEMALQVSRFCSSLQGILQRANFLGAETNPLEELMQLKCMW